MRLLYARHVLPAIGTASPLELGWLILARVLRSDPDFDRPVILQSARCKHATGGWQATVMTISTWPSSFRTIFQDCNPKSNAFILKHADHVLPVDHRERQLNSFKNLSRTGTCLFLSLAACRPHLEKSEVLNRGSDLNYSQPFFYRSSRRVFLSSRWHRSAIVGSGLGRTLWVSFAHGEESLSHRTNKYWQTLHPWMPTLRQHLSTLQIPSQWAPLSEAYKDRFSSWNLTTRAG